MGSGKKFKVEKEKIKSSSGRLQKKIVKAKKNKNTQDEELLQDSKYPVPLDDDKNLNIRKERKRKGKSSSKKRRNTDTREDEQANQLSSEGKSYEVNEGMEKSKMKRNKKRKGEKIVKSEATEIHKLHDESKDGSDEKDSTEKKDRKLRKKKRNRENMKEAHIHIASEVENEVGDDYNQQSGKTKKARKVKRKDQLSQNDARLLEKRAEAEHDEVYQISSGDEDCSRGMKKWITEYHRSRPGVNILQQRIDDFIVAHEAQEEQARKEKEAQAAEGGWTVVVHHKGRKKTTDAESGITVGSVAQAAVLDKLAKKKRKEVGLDFYRFQKRVAQRNEIMTLQSKFEQDKKRIQQMRAARKFRPY